MRDLVPRSGLEHLFVPGCSGPAALPGVAVALVQTRAFATVMIRRNRHAEVAAAAKRSFGINLPTTPRAVGTGAISFVWAGPGRWLAMAERTSGDAFVKQLREQLVELATVIDYSDTSILLCLSGPRARDVLAKGVLVDLHPRAFRPGDAAVTSIAHFQTHFWQTDETPTYEIAVPRSFAAAFWHYLIEAGTG